MPDALYNPYFQDTERMNAALLRFLPAAALAAVMSLSLFFLMQRLIGGEKVFIPPKIYPVPELPITPDQPPLEPRRRQPPQQPPDVELPPETPTPPTSRAPGDGIPFSIPRQPVEKTTGPKNGYAMTDGALVTLVAVRPIYPRRALVEGLSGYAIAEFTVNKQGTVENARIVGSEPGTVFDEAALNAIQKFRFRPEVQDGRAIAIDGVQKLFRFEIEDK